MRSLCKTFGHLNVGSPSTATNFSIDQDESRVAGDSLRWPQLSPAIGCLESESIVSRLFPPFMFTHCLLS